MSTIPHFAHLFFSYNVVTYKRGHRRTIYSIINGCWNIRSQDYSFPGTFIPWNFRFLQTFPSADHLFPEPFVPWNFRSRYPGPFLPRTIRSFVCRAVSGPLTKKEQRNKQKCRPITATVHSRYMQTVD